jgi:hypothetical protein
MQICTVPTVLPARRHLEAPLYAEIKIRIAVLNRYTALGIPVTEALG